MMATDIAVSFGQRQRMTLPPRSNYLKEWAELAGLTQAELGERCGYKRDHFNKIVQGTNRLTLEKKVKISRVLGSVLGMEIDPDALTKAPPSSDDVKRLSQSQASQIASHGEGDVRKLNLLRSIQRKLVAQYGPEA